MNKKILIVFLSVAFMLSACSIGNDTNKEKQQDENVQSDQANETGNSIIINLDFSPVSIKELNQGDPKKDWKKVRSLEFGDTKLQFYVDANNKEPYNTGSVYAFLEQKGTLYEIGDVGLSYGLDDVKVELINKKLTNGKQEYNVIGGIGTPFTEWTTIGFDKDNGRFISIPTMGRPQIVDLDNDGKDELVAVFDGTHLNPSNIYILRGNNGLFEIANIVKATGTPYAKLFENGKTTVIEAGKIDEEPHFYRYKDGKIIEDPSLNPEN